MKLANGLEHVTPPWGMKTACPRQEVGLNIPYPQREAALNAIDGFVPAPVMRSSRTHRGFLWSGVLLQEPEYEPADAGLLHRDCSTSVPPGHRHRRSRL